MRSAAAFHPGQSNMDVARAMIDLADATGQQFERIHQHLDLIGHGVAYGDYRRFLALAPSVSIWPAGRMRISSTRYGSYSYDEALFSLTFVQNLILKLQIQYVPVALYGPGPTGRTLVTTAQAQIVVYPSKDESPSEVLLDLPPGSELQEGSDGHAPEGFRAVLIDGEYAYIAADRVEYAEHKANS